MSEKLPLPLLARIKKLEQQVAELINPKVEVPSEFDYLKERVDSIWKMVFGPPDPDPSDDSILEDDEEATIQSNPWVIKDPCPKDVKGEDHYYNAEEDDDPWTVDIHEAKGYRIRQQAEERAMRLHREGDAHFRSGKKRLVVVKRPGF